MVRFLSSVSHLPPPEAHEHAAGVAECHHEGKYLEENQDNNNKKVRLTPRMPWAMTPNVIAAAIEYSTITEQTTSIESREQRPIITSWNAKALQLNLLNNIDFD